MAENILLIRLKAIGDVVLTLPAVNCVRDNFPSAKITFLTSLENAPLLEGFRAVDEVIALDRGALRSGNPLRMLPELAGLLRGLRGGRFSLAVDFQGYGETAWLTRFTGAPRRWGRPSGTGRKWAYTGGLTCASQEHAAAGHLELLRQGGLAIGKIRNEFQLPPGALAAARTFFAGQQLEPARPTLFIQPFTSGAHKNWPLENYLAVARHWRSQGVQIILGGGPVDRAALEPARQEGFVVSAGVPLLVTGGLMQLSTLVLGGDTGALHLAVALGRRVLMLMHEAHSASPSPFQHPDWVIKAPMPEAIARIPIAEMNTAVARVFNPPTGNAAC
jgi:ADP-heptose:LPS heptosyltransferase